MLSILNLFNKLLVESAFPLKQIYLYWDNWDTFIWWNVIVLSELEWKFPSLIYFMLFIGGSLCKPMIKSLIFLTFFFFLVRFVS